MILCYASSGGAFVAVSDYFLDNGDAVVCAVYNYKSHATVFNWLKTKKNATKPSAQSICRARQEKSIRLQRTG